MAGALAIGMMPNASSRMIVPLVLLGASTASAFDAALLANMKAATVHVLCVTPTNDVVVTGSGVVIGAGRYVATSGHVVAAVAEVGCRLVVEPSGSSERVTVERVLTESERKDLAVIALAGAIPAPPIVVASARDVAAGTEVYAIGFPSASDALAGGLSREPTVTRGIVGKLDLDDKDVLHIQSDAATNAGCSGGPLFTTDGTLIGIHRARATGSPGVNWAVAAEELLPELDRAGVPAPARLDRTPVSARLATYGEPLLLGLALGGLFTLAFVPTTRVSSSRARPFAPPRAERRPGGSDAHAVTRGDDAAADDEEEFEPVLRALSGPLTGLEIRLDRRELHIGRDAVLCAIAFPSDLRAISRRHCSIHVDARRRSVALQDAGSRNGTFAGDAQRLRPGERRELNPGDRFYVADAENVFELLG